MKARKIPETDSVEELARFWDTHDLTDFEDLLENVPKRVFERKPEMISALLETQQFDLLPLYRYQPLPAQDEEKKGWIKQIFVEHRLFFPSRNLFNDPFDCVVPSFLEIPGAVIKRYSEAFVERSFPNAPHAEKVEKLSKLMSVTALEGIRRDLQNDIDQAGVLSFSKVRDDILMWSHYADKHKGLCLEFDGSANSVFFSEAQPVEYGDYTPLPLDENPEKQMNRAILTKSKHWAYEQEYRIVRPGEACRLVEYPQELLIGVIFGCMMPGDLRQLIKQWVTEGNCRVAFFEARPRAGGFALDITRVA